MAAQPPARLPAKQSVVIATVLTAFYLIFAISSMLNTVDEPGHIQVSGLGSVSWFLMFFTGIAAGVVAARGFGIFRGRAKWYNLGLLVVVLLPLGIILTHAVVTLVQSHAQ